MVMKETYGLTITTLGITSYIGLSETSLSIIDNILAFLQLIIYNTIVILVITKGLYYRESN